MDTETFDPDLSTLLEPVATEPPCGPSIRYEPAFLQLRQSREEDDPSLPMGEWERPLRKADWRNVARNCAQLLTRSKDIQLAAWLCDAWLRQHQLRGFIAGIDLLSGLVERYWEGVHPRIEDGDSEARTAPFVWLNESLPVTLRLQVPLVFLADRKPPYLNLDDWERIVMPHLHRRSQEEEENESGEPGFTRDAVLAVVAGNGVRWLRQLRDEVGVALEKCDALARALDEQLAADAPSLGKVIETLRRLQRACTSLLDGRGEPAPEPPPRQEHALPAAMRAPQDYEEEESRMSAQPASSWEDTPMPTGPITTRQEAYRMLEEAAAFLQRTEPHSPTPYLVRRAVSWGQLSLPELMQEVVREEGDLTRFFGMLGLGQGRE